MIYSFNPNPAGRAVGDCSIRAVCAAFGMPWERAYSALTRQGMKMCDMPSSNAVWGAFLLEHGFRKRSLPESCVDGYTAGDFSEDHPRGVFVLALPGHVVCCRDGELWDSWDSEKEIVIYYFERVYS